MTIPDFSTRVQTTDEAAHTSSQTQLIYGPSGVGKTFYLGTIGPDGIIISIGEGHDVLASPAYKNKYPKEVRPHILKLVESYNPKTGIFDKAKAFDDVCDALDWILKNKKYKTVGIDDATFLSKYARNKALEVNLSMGKSKSLEDAQKSGFIAAAVQDYGAEISLLEQFLSVYVSQFKAAGIDFILTAHEKETYQKGATIGALPTLIKTRPGFTGQQFPSAIPAYFDLVWYFESIDTNAAGKPVSVFRARTVGNDSLTAKTRWGGIFPQYISDPNFTKIKAKIQSAIEVGNYHITDEE